MREASLRSTNMDKLKEDKTCHAFDWVHLHAIIVGEPTEPKSVS